MNHKAIWSLQNQARDIIEDESKLKSLGVQHFFKLFLDDGKSNIEDQLNIIRLFPSFVQEEDHEPFLSAFSLEEVKVVLKGFKKHRSPGPDGWPVELYLHFFVLLGQNILKVIEHSRQEGRVI